MIKKNLIFILVSVACAGLNLYGWQITLKLDTQLAWIALILIFLNLLLAWLTWRRNRYITVLFVASSFIIEILIFVNFFWMQKIGRTL
jgi:hypothetical protein